MSALIQRVKKAPKPPQHVQLCSKAVVSILPVAQIAIGAAYLNECPREHYIPIYLVVMGSFSLLLTLLSCLPCAQPKEGSTNFLHRLCTGWNSLVSAFVFCWFIAGNVWVYRIYEPIYVNNATTADIYCHKTVYLFAFWTITLFYILLMAFLVGGFCVLFCFLLCGRADPDD
uniref:Si:dkey-19b23.12 n=1 Tax=Neogobius melanostomus TaxID=47308 RepID=A0A8C6ULH1_9GOBI